MKNFAKLLILISTVGTFSDANCAGVVVEKAEIFITNTALENAGTLAPQGPYMLPTITDEVTRTTNANDILVGTGISDFTESAMDSRLLGLGANFMPGQASVPLKKTNRTINIGGSDYAVFDISYTPAELQDFAARRGENHFVVKYRDTVYGPYNHQMAKNAQPGDVVPYFGGPAILLPAGASTATMRCVKTTEKAAIPHVLFPNGLELPMFVIAE